jgi:hypothetical protein
MTEQIAQHPVLTILISWVGSGFLSALVAGIYNLRAKRSEYVNDYYKLVIKRRIEAYEQLERVIIQFKFTVVDDDKRGYHLPFASEEDKDWDATQILLAGVMSQGLWLSDKVFAKLRELNLILFRHSKPPSMVEFGKQQYEKIATLRAELERLLAQDMLTLHDVGLFLKTKDRPDPGFSAVYLKG